MSCLPFKVIEMSGVCAASDIWSVGCTVIELLTCVPPYYDLQPMPALFRIVQVGFHEPFFLLLSRSMKSLTRDHLIFDLDHFQFLVYLKH